MVLCDAISSLTSDPLGRGVPVNEKDWLWPAVSRNIIKDHGRTMGALYCIGYPLEETKSQLHWPMWSYHSMTGPTLKWVRSSQLFAAFVPASPLNSPQQHRTRIWMLIVCHTDCVKCLQGPEDWSRFSGGNKENMFGGVWIWESLLNTPALAKCQSLVMGFPS